MRIVKLQFKATLTGKLKPKTIPQTSSASLNADIEAFNARIITVLRFVIIKLYLVKYFI